MQVGGVWVRVVLLLLASTLLTGCVCAPPEYYAGEPGGESGGCVHRPRTGWFAPEWGIPIIEQEGPVEPTFARPRPRFHPVPTRPVFHPDALPTDYEWRSDPLLPRATTEAPLPVEDLTPPMPLEGMEAEPIPRPNSAKPLATPPSDADTPDWESPHAI